MSEALGILGEISCDTGIGSERLLPLVYEELRRLAAARMRRESALQTLQPTALVHEAWLRLGGSQVSWENQARVSKEGSPPRSLLFQLLIVSLYET